MYYLRLCTNGEDRAVFKAKGLNRYYRGVFFDINRKYFGMPLYTSNNIDIIMDLRLDMFNYSGEWFDVYTEDGKISEVDLPPQHLYRTTVTHTVYIYLADNVATTSKPGSDEVLGEDYIFLRRGITLKVYRYCDFDPENVFDDDKRIIAVANNGSYLLFDNLDEYLNSDFFN